LTQARKHASKIITSSEILIRDANGLHPLQTHSTTIKYSNGRDCEPIKN